MYKNQKVQLNVNKKTSMILEASAERLQSLKLESSATEQAPKILLISEAKTSLKLVSKNNHKTPTSRKVIIDPEEISETPKKGLKMKKALADNSKLSPKEVATPISETSNTPELKPEQPKPEKIVKRDPKTVCTCEILKSEQANTPIFVPKRQESQNVPQYRWVAVKSESLKTKEEKEAEIRQLLHKSGLTKDPATITTGRKRPLLCRYCWNKKQEERREADKRKIYQREREEQIARQNENKIRNQAKNGSGNSQMNNPKANSKTRINNRFGYLLDEESA